MKGSRAISDVLKNIRFPKAEMDFEFTPRRRGLGYTENYIVSEQDALQQLFSKRQKKFSAKLETPEGTKSSAVRRRGSQAS